MNEPLTSVPTEEHDLKETLRALQEAAWRIEAAFKAVGNDISEDDHLSHTGEMLIESGIDAVSVSMDMIEKMKRALGIDTSCGDDGPGAFKRAYT